MKNKQYKLYTKNQLEKYYTSLIPQIRAIAKECGYAIAIHGSLRRDMDIMAMPWIKEAKAPETLAINIMKSILGHSYMREYFKRHKYDAKKPHGRMNFCIPCERNGWIDMSVMPRIE